MDPTPNQPKALGELWQIALQYRWRFILPLFAVCVTVLAGSLLLPRKYRAEATFERRNDLVLTEITDRGASKTFQSPRGSLAEEVTGPPAIAHLMRTLEPTLRERGLIESRTDLANLEAQLLRRVVLHWDISSGEFDRVRLEFTYDDPRLAALVVNGLVENYIDRTREAMEAQLFQAANFYKTEVQRSQAIIERLENRLIEFEIDNAQLLPQHPNNLQNKLSLVQDELTELTSLREGQVIRVRSLEEAVASEPATTPSVVTGPNPELNRLEEKRRELVADLDEALRVFKMTEQHPEVALLRQRIEGIEEQIASADREVVTARHEVSNPKRAELELRLTTARSELAAINDQIDALHRQVRAMDSETQQMFPVLSAYGKLNREVEQARRQVGFWEDNLRRVEMALAAKNGDRGVKLDFIMPAHTPRRPVSPNAFQVIALATLLGLMAGSISVFLAYRSDESIRSAADVEREFELPLLGAVSELITRRHRRVRRLRALVLYPLNLAAMAAIVLVFAAWLYMDLQRPELLSELLGDGPAGGAEPAALADPAPDAAQAAAAAFSPLP